MRILYFVACLLLLQPVTTQAEELQNNCAGNDRACLFNLLENAASRIGEQAWRDSTYREMAKLLTKSGQNDRAVALIEKIQTPDTKAMTIRAIGIAAAEMNLSRDAYNVLFTRLKKEADKIEHQPSHEIAVNYIADAEALSGDDDSSLKTAMSIKNPEMRNKALYDSSKIQAENGRIASLLAGIAAIDDPNFRDKALRTASKIRAERNDYDGALQISHEIRNDYQRTQSILYILVRQITPEEVSIQ